MLNDIHQFTYNNINDEILWIASMPCRLNGDKSIPIADYGSSNIGKMKSICKKWSRLEIWKKYATPPEYAF